MNWATSTPSFSSWKFLKQFALLASLCFAMFAAACGGGGSTPTPPPPTGNFSNASLKGQYAFFMSGTILTNNGSTFFARIGSFTADGNGNITTGIEDVDVTGPERIPLSPSTYTIQADGRGVVNLVGSGPLSFSVTLLSPTQGLMVETDLNATASGTFFLQDSSSFTTAGFNGNYVFDVSGLDFNPQINDPLNSPVPDSIVGQFVSNGSGGLSGVLDENDDANPSGGQPFTSGSFQLDATNGPTFGRGTMTFVANGVTYNYIYYVVNGSRLVLIEDSSGSGVLTVGTATAQASVPTSNATFNGSFAFLTSGSGTSGPITRIGRFSANGSGALTSVFADTNDNGGTAQVPKGSLSATTYAIDTNFTGSGRGTLTFTDSQLGTFSFVFYLSSPSGGVIQDVSINNNKGNVGDGFLQLQTGAPFTQAGVAGAYGFNFAGVSSNNNTTVTAEEDFVGQMTLSSAASNNVTGAVDFSEFSSNQGVFLNVVLSGTGLTIGGDGTTSSGMRNALALKPLTNPSSTINFVPYFVDSQHMFVAGTDSDRVLSGVITLQNP
jgi:hypothetical protein